jgi:murein L,D-transpeptidase YafK
VHVFPFRVTEANLAAQSGHPSAGFWQNLKQGHDLFEATRVPPAVVVCGGAYAFDGTSAARCEPIRAW